MITAWLRSGLTEDDLVTESALQIIAGSDANATAIRMTMLGLTTNPVAYRALQQEIDAACDKMPGRLSYSELQKLPYLQCVIREGMRWFPPAVDPAPKVVPEGGDTIVVDGVQYDLPGGTSICNSAWGLLHRKDIFGEDAEIFRPERWLEADGQRFARMSQTAELVFGHGRWQCIGMLIAKMQLNKVFAEVRKSSSVWFLIISLQALIEFTACAKFRLRPR